MGLQSSSSSSIPPKIRSLIAGKGFATAVIIALMCSINCKKNSDLHRLETPSPRIISFAPSITETVYALGLEEHLVGVTDYCTWPPEAEKLPKVGGYINPNYEQILRLQPEMAILLREHAALIAFLAKYKIRTVTINNENIAGIYESIRIIADSCGVPERADSLVATMQKELQPDSIVPYVKPRILFCVGRDRPGSGSVGTVYCAGPRSFYNEIISYAGGVNAYSDSLVAYPSLAGEGVLRLAPDIIIDAMASNKGMAPEAVKADWDELSMLPAVKMGAVYALTGSYISIPGPRVARIGNDIRNCIKDWRLRTARGSACLHFR